jgi:hypothetical protein
MRPPPLQPIGGLPDGPVLNPGLGLVGQLGPVAPITGRMRQPLGTMGATVGPRNGVVQVKILETRPHRLPTPRTPRPRHQGGQQRLPFLLMTPSQALFGG